MKKNQKRTTNVYKKPVVVQEPRICFFDIEATNLNANFGFTLCVSWKWAGQSKIYTSKISDSKTFKRDVTNDKFVIEEASAELSKADMWVTWYGSRFDVPFLNTRLLYHGLPILPDTKHVDGWRIARYKMKLHSNRLASVSAFLGLEDKTALMGDQWIKAAAGNKNAINYVVKHCEQDIIVLEQAYMKIRGLLPSHPNLALISQKDGIVCPNCGSTKLHSKGIAYTQTNIYRKYYCTQCGRWPRARISEKDIVKPQLI